MDPEHRPELFWLLESGSVVNLSNFRLKSGQICRSIEIFFRRKALTQSWRIVLFTLALVLGSDEWKKSYLDPRPWLAEAGVADADPFRDFRRVLLVNFGSAFSRSKSLFSSFSESGDFCPVSAWKPYTRSSSYQ
jgi:hypothetical protein